ncbi:hypothetical protein KAW50_02600 [candidate division WOR-3 bacterium]|nr:hypothetical protein [candidate division WOR-3 bacterium]
MSIGVRVFPYNKELEEFLETKGLNTRESNVHVLHYSGNKIKELKHLLKEDKPDLLVNHSIPSFKEFNDQIQVYHPIRTFADVIRQKKIWTNNFDLCQHYYQRLGLQKEILIIPKRQSKKREVNFQLARKKVINLLEKFKRFMLWT